MKLFSRSYILGSSMLLFLALQYVIPSLLFFIKIPITPLYFPICLALTVLWIAYLVRKFYKEGKFIKQLVINSLLLFMFISLSMLFAMLLYDVTFDGQFYHQDAIIFLTEGWNPVYEYVNFGKIIDFYSKAAWIIWACSYSLFDLIEIAKYTNFLLVFASFFMSLAALQKVNKHPVVLQIIFSAILALNPVSIYQSASYYLDGMMGSVILCLIALLVIYDCSTKTKEISFLIIFVSIVLANLKFTGLGFAIIILGGFVLLQLLRKEKKEFTRAIIISAIAGILGFGVMGYQTYVKNIKDSGHPFYPLQDGTLLDLHRPANLNNKNRIQKLLISNFSRSVAFLTYEENTQLKVPFDTGDKNAFVAADVKVGGFGSLFGGILILSSICLILYIIIERKKGWLIYYLLATILISVLIISGTWWARYIPQFFVIPVIIITVAVLSKNKVVSILGYLCILAFLFNIYLVSTNYYERTIGTSRLIKKQLERIDGMPVEIILGCFESTEKRFSEKNLDYEIIKLMDYPQSIKLFGGAAFTRFRFTDSCYTKSSYLVKFEENKNKYILSEEDKYHSVAGEDTTLFGESAYRLSPENENVLSIKLAKVNYGDIIEISFNAQYDSLKPMELYVVNDKLELKLTNLDGTENIKRVNGATIIKYDFDSIEIKIKNIGVLDSKIDRLRITHKQIKKQA